MKERKQCGNCVGIFSLLSESSTVLCVVLYGGPGGGCVGGACCSLHSKHRASVTAPFISLQMELNVASEGCSDLSQVLWLQTSLLLVVIL